MNPKNEPLVWLGSQRDILAACLPPPKPRNSGVADFNAGRYFYHTDAPIGG
jgi:hypothetical protein